MVKSLALTVSEILKNHFVTAAEAEADIDDSIRRKRIRVSLKKAHSVMTRLPVLWKTKAVRFPAKIKLHKSLVLSTLLCGCESCTLITVHCTLEIRIQAFGNKCNWSMLGMSYKNANRTTIHESSSIFSPDVRNCYCQL